MKYYVFQGVEGELKNNFYICSALKATRVLENSWKFEAEHMKMSHSKVEIEEDDDLSTKIALENDDICQLIDDCMQWAKEYYVQQEFLKSLMAIKP